MKLVSWKTAALAFGCLSMMLGGLLWLSAHHHSSDELSVLTPADLAGEVHADDALGTVYLVSGDMDELPPGWVACAGQALDKREYPLLVTAFGSRLHDAGSPDEFTMPDLRGLFRLVIDDKAFPWWLRLLGAFGDPDAKSGLMLGGPMRVLLAEPTSDDILSTESVSLVVKARPSR